MLVLIIIAGVVVLLLAALPFAKRHDERKGHKSRGMGELRSTLRDTRMDLRTVRRTGHRTTRPEQRRPGQKGR